MSHIKTPSSGQTRLGPLAVLSSSLPPDPTGQARVLQKVLGGLGPDELILISDKPEPEPNSGGLPGTYISLNPVSERALPLPALPGLRRLNAQMGLQRSIKRRGQELARALTPHGPRALVGCSGTVVDPPAGLLAARALGIPYIFYSFDDYRFQWGPGIYRTVALRWEQTLMQGVSQVIVPNISFAQAYAMRYGTQPQVVLNPAEPAAYAQRPCPWPLEAGKLRVVFTGSVYWGHYDALGAVARALSRLGNGAELHIYSDQDAQVLADNGISGPVVHHPFVAPPEIFQVQQQADVLLLPLAFDSTIPEAVRTACPAKVGEYLASGRPILAHVPPDCFVSSLFRERRCAAVVDQQDETELITALSRLLTDQAWREGLVRCAGKVAQEFTQEAARKAFSAVIDRAVKVE